MGGLQELVARFPIKHLVDHGENSTPQSSGTNFIQGYMELAGKVPRTSVKAGDKIPIAGLEWLIVSSDGTLLSKPLPGAGRPNPACA